MITKKGCLMPYIICLFSLLFLAGPVFAEEQGLSIQTTELLEPEAVPAENAQPETEEPEAIPAESAQPETVEPEAIPAESAQPETEEPEAIPAESAQPEAEEPEAIPAESAQPEAVEHKAIPAESAQPKATAPEAIPAESAQPEAVEPVPSQPVPKMRYSNIITHDFKLLREFKGPGLKKPSDFQQETEAAYVLFQRQGKAILLVTPKNMLTDAGDNFIEVMEQCMTNPASSWIVLMPRNTWIKADVNPYCSDYSENVLEANLYWQKGSDSLMPVILELAQDAGPGCTRRLYFLWDNQENTYSLINVTPCG